MIYICSPYTHDDKGVMYARVQAVKRALPRLTMDLQQPVYSPVVYGHLVDPFAKEMGYDYWLNHGLTMLSLMPAAAVFRLPGWEQSRGIKTELRRCGELQRAVYWFTPTQEEYDELRVRHV